LTLVGDVIVIAIAAGASRYIARIGNAVVVAIRLAFVGDQVCVAVRTGALFHITVIGNSVGITVVALNAEGTNVRFAVVVAITLVLAFVGYGIVIAIRA